MAASRELTIDLERGTPEAASAQIFAVMAYPELGSNHAKAALGGETSLLLQRYNVGLPVGDVSRQRLNRLASGYRLGRPFGVQADERVVKRIAMAHHAMPMILQRTNVHVSRANSHQRLSLQACLRSLQRELGQKDARGLERHYWEASFPVLHLAAAFNFYIRSLNCGGYLQSPDHGLFNDPSFIRAWLIVAQVFERLVAERWPRVARSRGQVHVAVA